MLRSQLKKIKNSINISLGTNTLISRFFHSSVNKNNSFNNTNNNNYNKFKWLSLLCIFIILMIKYLSPSLYDYIMNLISIDPYWIKYSLLIWIIGWLIHYILEFYFYIVFSIDSNYYITKPKYLPKFIFTWLNRIEDNSKVSSQAKHWFLQMYIRIILFHLSLTFLYLYLFIL